jgi:hypothetical protein
MLVNWFFRYVSLANFPHIYVQHYWLRLSYSILSYRLQRDRKNFTCTVNFYQVKNFGYILVLQGKSCWLWRNFNYRVSEFGLLFKIKTATVFLNLRVEHIYDFGEKTAISFYAQVRQYKFQFISNLTPLFYWIYKICFPYFLLYVYNTWEFEYTLTKTHYSPVT